VGMGTLYVFMTLGVRKALWAHESGVDPARDPTEDASPHAASARLALTRQTRVCPACA